MRRSTSLSAIALVAACLAVPALAQTAPPAASPPAASPPTAPPSDAPPSDAPPSNAAPAAQLAPGAVIATVDGQPIHMADLQDAANNLPQQLQQLPPDQLFPLLVNQQIDRKALLIAAQKQNLQNDPKVAAAMRDAADEKLENAYVQQKVSTQMTDAAVQAEYNKDYANKPGPEQVEARHILVKTQAEADSIIKQLNHGASFAKLAQKDSIDPGSKDGGELGWFGQGDMVPAFSDAAFALKTGQYTKTPVQSQFGWHVILLEGRRHAPTPPLDDALKQQIRNKIADDIIKATLTDARSQVKIVVNNPDGTPATIVPDGSASGGTSGAPASQPAVRLPSP